MSDSPRQDAFRQAAPGWRLQWLRTIDSTNTEALRRIRNGSGEAGQVLGADHQTAGRGRSGKRWESRRDGLLFSVILPAFERKHTPRAGLAAGLAVCEAVESLCSEAAPRIKWPNDVYADGRKLAGVLVETATGSAGAFTVVGVGLNLGEPPSEAGPAAALQQWIADPCPYRTLEAILAAVRRWWPLVDSRRDQRLIQAIRSRCLLTGTLVEIDSPGMGVVSGTCLGLADDGALRIATAEGERRALSGTIVGWRCAED